MFVGNGGSGSFYRGYLPLESTKDPALPNGNSNIESVRRQVLREILEALALQTDAPCNEYQYRLDVQVKMTSIIVLAVQITVLNMLTQRVSWLLWRITKGSSSISLYVCICKPPNCMIVWRYTLLIPDVVHRLLLHLHKKFWKRELWRQNKNPKIEWRIKSGLLGSEHQKNVKKGWMGYLRLSSKRYAQAFMPLAHMNV